MVKIDFLNDSFFFFKSGFLETIRSIEDSCHLVSVPASLENPTAHVLISLGMPAHGAKAIASKVNWNAFRDTLCVLLMRATAQRVALIHETIPMVQDADDAHHYVSCLYEYLGDFSGSGRPLFAVGFPKTQKEIIESLGF